MEQNTITSTGRRKTASASARVMPGKGVFTINGRQLLDYLDRETLADVARSPLAVTELQGRLDVICKASGGGMTGQAGAVRLALARALCRFNPDLRSTLRKAGFLARDAREVERKKYGRPKARKRFQYSKR